MSKRMILGVLFDDLTFPEALSACTESIGKYTRVVYTPNAEIAYDCLKSPDMCSLVNSADICLPDGAGVVLASKILKSPLKEKVAGVEIGEAVIEEASKQGFPVFLFGGKPGIAEAAARKLSEKYKGLIIAGTESGYFNDTDEENDRIVRKIDDSGASVLLCCLGAPKQEIWAGKYRGAFKTPKLILCLGGSLDIYSGEKKRAPAFFIRLKLEWLWRLIKQPSRIKRMKKLPAYVSAAIFKRGHKK